MKYHDSIMEHWKRAREEMNPLRSLTISYVVTLLEEAQRGIQANYQWTCKFIEERFPVLMALVEKRTSPLLEMDWEIKTVDDSPAAKKQADALRMQYEAVDNIYDVIEFMAMANFRGYSHIEKVFNPDGDLVELREVDQWNVAQDRAANRWRYNPGAIAYDYDYFGSEADMLPESFIIHRAKRPINAVALEQFVRFKFSEKDWDAFMEIYGIPSGVVTLGPESKGSEETYLDMAEAVASGGSGVLPNGAEYRSNAQVRGEKNPFSERLDKIEQQIVLAGTGGMLTMLTESGSGTLAGGAHTETFNTIAAKDARRISETLQRQLDKPFLSERFPAQPALAYFDLNFREETDVDSIIEHAVKLSQAGYKLDPQVIMEKTGYEVTANEAEEILGEAKERIQAANREGFESEKASEKALADALGVAPEWLRPIRKTLLDLERKANDGSLSDQDYLKALEEATNKIPELFEGMGVESLTEAMESAMGAGMLSGAAQGMAKQTTL